MSTALRALAVLMLALMISIAATAGEVLSKALESVVMIIPMDEQMQPLGLGSGFIITEDGQVATNYHVIAGASSAMLRFVANDKMYAARSVVYKSPEHDIAVIRIDVNAKPLALGDDNLLQVGQRVYAVGNPEGLEGTVSEGIVSGFRKIAEEFRIMQITAPISPGSSGGPVITPEGEVVGIASASLVTGQNLNFAIPVTQLKIMLRNAAVEEPFAKASLPQRDARGIEDPSIRTGLVSITDLELGGYGSLTFTIVNKLTRDIVNIRFVVVWRKPDTREMIHYNPLQFSERVAAGHSRRGHKGFIEGYLLVPADAVPEIRLIDYEILATSGAMEFK